MTQIHEQFPPHSYEEFASLTFNKDLDEELLAMAPQVESHTDLATGSGIVIRHALRLAKYDGPSWNVTGVDIDPEGLAIAQAELASFGDHIRFIESGVQEEIPGIAPASQDLVTFFNAIHLTDPALSLREAARIAKPGATLLVSSAYEQSANPDPAGRMLMIAMRNARTTLMAQGFKDFPKTESLIKYSNDDYRAIAQQTGFTGVEIVTRRVEMDRNALKAIFDSRDFALGVFPAVPLDAAAAALVASIDPMLERFERDTLPRNYMLIKATRADLPITT